MAVYVSNLELQTGCDFYQEFSLTNPDFSPVDLTGCFFHGAFQKHPTALDANSADSARVTNKLTTQVLDATNGLYCIKFGASQSSNIKEGKYVYQVVMVDPAGRISPAASGLLFIDKGFGFILDLEPELDNIDGGAPGDIVGPDTLIIDGGTPTTVGSGPDIDGGNPLDNGLNT